MVNSSGSSERGELSTLTAIVRVYVVVALLTVATLGVLSRTIPQDAPRDAWVHAVVVAVFAVILPLRLHAARGGSTAGLRAVGVVAGVLVLVNVVEAALPHQFPVWMRLEMVGIALLMVAVVLLVVRERRAAASAPR